MMKLLNNTTESASRASLEPMRMRSSFQSIQVEQPYSLRDRCSRGSSTRDKKDTSLDHRVQVQHCHLQEPLLFQRQIIKAINP